MEQVLHHAVGVMPNRILKESICTSRTLEGLKAEEERFFYRLLVNCDDYGRCDGRPSVLRAKCFPVLLAKVREADVKRWLSALVGVGLVHCYQVEGEEYLEVVTWEEHQQVRAKRSKYPEPPAHASIRNHLPADASNSRHMSPESESESLSESESNPIQAASKGNGALSLATTAPVGGTFDEFWKLYPKRRKKADARLVWKRIGSAALLEAIRRALAWQMRTEDWLKEGGKYIPNPATYLNAQQWEDEPVALPVMSEQAVRSTIAGHEWLQRRRE